MQKCLEIVKRMGNPINQPCNIRRYKTGYCFTAKELYETTNPAKWNVTETLACKLNYESRFVLCGYVLVYFLYLVFVDMISNNVTFELPTTGRKEGRFYIKCFQDDLFRKLYAGGKFLGIDFLKSEFKGYQIYYQWKYNKTIKEKPVYISNNMKNWMYSKVNQGMQYY